ncbi:hypothetical protein OU995_11885 [Roseateles sp. SL47]|uniref:hypothetical protein n=1 Tax=Roseateles sp. SL47 TaxID=2995138 RepID=UPI00226E388A|nr:hypothetical protein [Roseateles sp. SL47]WAC75349.1 hypothetical protein OU995_11885 [Roseateles sp. SL47]
MTPRRWLGLAGLVILGGLFVLAVTALGLATILCMGAAKVWQDLRAYVRDLSASP